MTPTNRMRNRNKWTVPEILTLQREFELLKLSLQEIADKHGRSVCAIEYKLVEEDFATWEQIFELRLTYPNDDDEVSIEPSLNYSNDESEVSILGDRVFSLEKTVTEMKNLVTQMFDNMISNSSKRQNNLNTCIR